MINQKGLYGLISGIATTSILQPFQNIKMALMIPPKSLKLEGNFATNIKTSCQYIYRNDGYKGFYKGMIAAMCKAGLGCYTYFTTLKYLEQRWQQHQQQQESLDHSSKSSSNPIDNLSSSTQQHLNNFLFSSIGRIISSIITNPLSIIETRFELADFHEYSSVHGAMKDIYQKEGIRGFFSGGLTSCLKEGIFAGFYYMLYEELKSHDINRMMAGIGAGMLSTATTHPFQLIRARLQTMGLQAKPIVENGGKIQKHRHLLWEELQKLHKNGQWMKGLAPRLIKKPLANTLTFVIFEVIDEVRQVKKMAH